MRAADTGWPYRQMLIVTGRERCVAVVEQEPRIVLPRRQRTVRRGREQQRAAALRQVRPRLVAALGRLRAMREDAPVLRAVAPRRRDVVEPQRAERACDASAATNFLLVLPIAESVSSVPDCVCTQPATRRRKFGSFASRMLASYQPPSPYHVTACVGGDGVRLPRVHPVGVVGELERRRAGPRRIVERDLHVAVRHVMQADFGGRSRVAGRTDAAAERLQEAVRAVDRVVVAAAAVQRERIRQGRALARAGRDRVVTGIVLVPSTHACRCTPAVPVLVIVSASARPARLTLPCTKNS